MRVLIRKCDRCGKIISEETINKADIPMPMPGRYTISFTELTKSAENKAETTSDTYEMCDDCAVEFLDWMKKKDTRTVEPSLNAPKNLDIPEKQPYKLKPGTRTHHRWTNEEDDFLVYRSADLTTKQIAYKLGVSVAAVQARLYRLSKGMI